MISQNIFENINSALLTIEKWKADNLKLAFTNGCFDLFHRGHVHILETGATLGEVIVAVVSDGAIKQYKSDERPFITERDRKDIIDSSKYVHKSFICDTDPHSMRVIETIEPDIILMGNENTKEQRFKIEKLREKLPEIEVIVIDRWSFYIFV